MPGSARAVTPSWWGSTAPSVITPLGGATWIGGDFQFASAGKILGLRAYNRGTDVKHCMANIWQFSPNPLRLLHAHHFRDGSYASLAWSQMWLRPYLPVVTGHTYRVAILRLSNYGVTSGALTSPVTNNGIIFMQSWSTTATMPITASLTPVTDAYGIDILFQAS